MVRQMEIHPPQPVAQPAWPGQPVAGRGEQMAIATVRQFALFRGQVAVPFCPVRSEDQHDKHQRSHHLTGQIDQHKGTDPQ
ncbi:hypothetical protein D3C71_1956160 [compost metagenome]